MSNIKSGICEQSNKSVLMNMVYRRFRLFWRLRFMRGQMLTQESCNTTQRFIWFGCVVNILVNGSVKINVDELLMGAIYFILVFAQRVVFRNLIVYFGD